MSFKVVHSRKRMIKMLKNFKNKLNPSSYFQRITGLEGLFSSYFSGSKIYHKFSFFPYRLFEYFILTVIILNSIALSIYDYKDRQSLTRKN